MPTYSNGAGYFLYVNDVSEVYRYNVPQGNSMFFMHRTKPEMYLKSVNVFNQQTVTTFDIVERQPASPQMPEQQIMAQPEQNVQVGSMSKDDLVRLIQETVRNEIKTNPNPNRAARKGE